MAGMKFTLIRHTKVDVPPGICYGKQDVGLAGSFPEEADLIRRAIAGIRFDAVFSSPLHRCRHLAGILFPGTEIRTDIRLREMDFGDWEGQSWDAIAATDEGRIWFANYWRNPCPGGESAVQMSARVRSFIDDLTSASDGQSICIVSHSGPIRAFLHQLNGIPVEELFRLDVPFGAILSAEAKPRP